VRVPACLRSKRTLRRVRSFPVVIAAEEDDVAAAVSKDQKKKSPRKVKSSPKKATGEPVRCLCGCVWVVPTLAGMDRGAPLCVNVACQHRHASPDTTTLAAAVAAADVSTCMQAQMGVAVQVMAK
jgi:hypothetical protein